MTTAHPRFARSAWLTLAFLLGVVLWGAYVRATGSGAGCGAHWPLCNGVVVPREASAETLIEYSHRASSGVLMLLVVGVAVAALRLFPRGHRVRRAALATVFFGVLEALIGAGLVLFEMVADNESVARGWWMAAHLVNTFLFMAAAALTAWWGSGMPGPRRDVLRADADGGASAVAAQAPKRTRPDSHRAGRGRAVLALGVGLAAMLVLGTSGAIAALGDTLFPARSLAEGVRQDFSPAAHVFLRLRIAHPLIAIVVGGYLLVVSAWVAKGRSGWTGRFARAVGTLVLVQVAAGFVNVALLAPVWMQLLHLLLADALWIVLVLLTAVTLADRPGDLETADRAGSAEPHPQPV